jgi:response regulator of citrate/malate metabolism
VFKSADARPSTRARVLIAEDHPQVAEVISKLVGRNFDVVGTVGTDTDALRSTMELNPQILILDLFMPDRRQRGRKAIEKQSMQNKSCLCECIDERG